MPRGVYLRSAAAVAAAAAEGPEDDLPDGPVQRTVPAARTTPPATSAARSAFDLARPAGWRAPPATPPQVVIRKGIPLPPVRKGIANAYQTALEAMEVGDSVELPMSQAKSFYARAKELMKGRAPPRHYTYRKLSATTGGVWRDA